VGYNVAKSIARGDPIVVLIPHRPGWRMRPYNQTGAAVAACAHLRADSPSG
jgi:hypothetical protein